MLRFRFWRHGLHREPGSITDPCDIELFDYGVQDTGPDGAAWALACRGLDRRALGEDLVLAWTLRGAPHAYRRADLPTIALATSPFAEADAAKRIFDAAKPIKAAGMTVLEALGQVSLLMAATVDEPRSKGEVSTRLTEQVDDHHLRWCRPCQATHLYEQSFRLSALQAGIELQPATSPPVMQRVEGLDPLHWSTSGAEAPDQFHVIRNYLRFYGPGTPQQAAAFIDSPVKVIKEHWPSDTVAIEVADRRDRATRAEVLASDLNLLDHLPETWAEPIVRLLGPYDPYLQLRDRELLVPDEDRRKDLWRVLGRPGAIVVDGDVVGTWRPKSSGRKVTVTIDPWRKWSKSLRAEIQHQAERLAAHRGVDLANFT